MAEYWYNINFHGAIGMMPFKVVYGRDPPPLLRATSFDVHRQLEQRDELLQVLKMNLLKAQQRMKIQEDKKRIDLEINVDDWVLSSGCYTLTGLTFSGGG